jgi:hypothetical protein
LLPGFVRRPLRGALNLVRTGRYSPLRPPLELLEIQLRLHRVRKSLTGLQAATGPEQLSLALMQRIVRAWGNTGWTGDAGFLLELARTVWQSRGPVLDCGSGLSTVISAIVAAHHGATVWSLEQDPRWFREVRRMLSGLGITNVILWYAPLRPQGDYVWYDLEGRNLPARFGTVACDGPSVRRSQWPPALHQSWRVGVVPVLEDLGVSFDRILLDDASDPRAPGLLARWRSRGLILEEVESPTGRHIRGGRPGVRMG